MATFQDNSHLFEILVVLASLNVFTFQESVITNSIPNTTDCTTTEKITLFHSLSTNETTVEESLADGTKKDANISHLKTLTVPTEWDSDSPTLNFPKTPPDERYRMANLHLDKGLFVFEFLRGFLSFIQPYDVPIDLLTDAVENRVDVSRLIAQTTRLEAAFIAVVAICGILMFVVPGTELWLACRPLREDYKPPRHPGVLAFFLTALVLIMGASVVTMIICNEEVGSGIERIPTVMQTALQDLRDYHSGTTVQLRKCLTRSLDVTSEAILADLDNVEGLLGKPVQSELSAETGLDVALDALLDVGNATQDISNKVDSLLKSAERARDRGIELSREAENLRRELEIATKGCSLEDRSLCATLNPSGLHVALRLELITRDDRLLRLRAASRENLTEAGRQARGEYLYVPHHISRNTLDARNQIRREINIIRARIFDETRSVEVSSTELTKQLESARNIVNEVVPYINAFERIRWFVGLGTILCILFIWILLLGALCCRCGSSEDSVRPTLLWTVLFSSVISIALWLVIICALALSTHTELLLCRPLHDPEYRAVEAIIETKVFLGRRMSIPLKDVLEKCQQNEAAYPAFQLGSSLKLEQLTAHWTWTGLSRALSKLKVDLTGLNILTPSLHQRLQNLLYASGPNLTEHRILIQGPILEQDLITLSDQIDSVARQMRDRRTARELQIIGSSMRDLLSRRVKPLMKMQDELVYQLAVLELQLQPLQRQVNQSLSHLKTIQYYIDNQGEKIAQMRTKLYKDRLSNYLDQWRKYVLMEMGTEVAKCQPLWNVFHGVRLLVCQHILGPLNGFWFTTFLCAAIMIISTPMAHCLALVYRKDTSMKDLALLHSRTESPDTVVIERDSWQIPEPPPPQDGW